VEIDNSTGLNTGKRKQGFVQLLMERLTFVSGMLSGPKAASFCEGVESSCLLLLEVSGRMLNPPKESSARLRKWCVAG